MIVVVIVIVVDADSVELVVVVVGSGVVVVVLSSQHVSGLHPSLHCPVLMQNPSPSLQFPSLPRLLEHSQ